MTTLKQAYEAYLRGGRGGAMTNEELNLLSKRVNEAIEVLDLEPNYYDLQSLQIILNTFVMVRR